MADYLAINRANWDDRVPAHAESADYKVARFLARPDFISDVVRFDLPLLGNISGLRGAHLQCHIGTDTISLARLGASMSGLDFSGAAVEAARQLASDTGTDATFVQSDVYEAAEALGAGRFDLEHPEPNITDSGKTYVETGASIEHTITHWWNHGIGETITSLLNAGLRIRGFTEHDSVPWLALPGVMEAIGNGEYRLTDNPRRLPCTFTLQAVKDR